MSEDPISKSKIGAGMGKRDLIPKSQGPGNIFTDKDYAGSYKSLRSRIIYLICCALPYVGICVFIYLEGLETLGIILLAIPLVLFLIFWFLKRKLS